MNMSSLSREKVGSKTHYRVWFDVNGRKAVRLGLIAKSSANEIRVHIANLEKSANTNTDPPTHTLEWLKDTSDKFHLKLSNACLVAPRRIVANKNMDIEEFVESFIESKKSAKPSTITNHRAAKIALVAYFKDKPIREITGGDAMDW
jgi:integrase